MGSWPGWQRFGSDNPPQPTQVTKLGSVTPCVAACCCSKAWSFDFISHNSCDCRGWLAACGSTLAELGSTLAEWGSTLAAAEAGAHSTPSNTTAVAQLIRGMDRERF